MMDDNATTARPTASREPSVRSDVRAAESSNEKLAKLSISSWLDGIDRLVLTTQDGVPLNVYHTGDPQQRAVLLINPLGVSVLLLAPLMRYLGYEYFVMSWESRGLPSFDPGRDDIPVRIEDHLGDIRMILSHFDVRSVDVVAYCSGTLVALPLLAGPSSASKAVFISPSVLVEDKIRLTSHQRTVVPIWQDVVNKGKDYCAIISNLMAPARPQSGNIDSELDYVNRLPFADGELAYRYAQVLASANRVLGSKVFSDISVPVLLVHANDDHLIHVDLSHYIGRHLPSSRVHVIDVGGHYAICKDEGLHRVIKQYLAASESCLAKV